MLSRHMWRTYQGKELTRSSSGNARPHSSQLAEPLWIDPNLTLKKKLKKNAEEKRFINPSPQTPANEGKPPDLLHPMFRYSSLLYPAQSHTYSTCCHNGVLRCKALPFKMAHGDLRCYTHIAVLLFPMT